MTVEFSTANILQIIGALFVATVAIVFITRRHFRKQEAQNLTEKHRNRKWSSPLEARTKYPELNVFALRGTILNYSLFLALGLMILAFGWTTFDEKVDVSMYLGMTADEIEMEMPRTAEPPPPPPPPPAPTAMQIVEDDLLELETVTFEDMSISEQTSIEAPRAAPEQKEVAAPPPPPPPAFEEKEKEIFKIVETMPMFPGCEDVADKEQRKLCAEEKMLEFIYSNIEYPGIARDNGIAGMVVVQFVVETDGSISNVQVVRDIGGGCGEEAVRVINMMPAWNPGKQRDRPVRVMFTLPIRFILA